MITENAIQKEKEETQKKEQILDDFLKQLDTTRIENHINDTIIRASEVKKNSTRVILSYTIFHLIFKLEDFSYSVILNRWYKTFLEPQLQKLGYSSSLSRMKEVEIVSYYLDIKLMISLFIYKEIKCLN